MFKIYSTIVVSFCIALSTSALAHQKVVVVPLGGGEEAPNRETGNFNENYFNASKAYTIAESKSITGRISSADDVDFYEIYSPFCQQFEIEIVGAGGDTCGGTGVGNEAIDSFIEFYGSNGTTLLSGNEDISSNSSPNGNYCSKVIGFTGNEGFYYIKVESSPAFCANCVFNYKMVLKRTTSLC